MKANFYKLSRKKNKILLKYNKLIGDKWSFDSDNRKKIPKNILIPDFLRLGNLNILKI